MGRGSREPNTRSHNPLNSEARAKPHLRAYWIDFAIPYSGRMTRMNGCRARSGLRRPSIRILNVPVGLIHYCRSQSAVMLKSDSQGRVGIVDPFAKVP
jgi:hypothetical protein